MRRWWMPIFCVLAACNYETKQPPISVVFSPQAADVSLAEAFSRINLQLFDSTGGKVFSKVQTQQSGADAFGAFSWDLRAGRYVVVAVGHSSPRSATIKSPEMVQFTMQDGVKLSNTFCWCDTVEVTNDPIRYTMTMRRVSAMFRLVLTDAAPSYVDRFVFRYTGGSANFNAVTGYGCSRSTQTETRVVRDSLEVFTFPYMGDSCKLEMSVAAMAGADTVRLRTFSEVPMIRNHITEYSGDFFGPDPMQPFVITFNAQTDWEGVTVVRF